METKQMTNPLGRDTSKHCRPFVPDMADMSTPQPQLRGGLRPLIPSLYGQLPRGYCAQFNQHSSSQKSTAHEALPQYQASPSCSPNFYDLTQDDDGNDDKITHSPCSPQFVFTGDEEDGALGDPLPTRMRRNKSRQTSHKES